MRLTLSEAFEVLGVPQDTSPELVRQAYRQLALRFHPDKNPDADATATFQRVSAAYKRICDHRERQQQAPGTWASTGSPFFDVSDDEMDEDDLGFDDDVSLEEMLFMFKMMFGVSSGGRKQPASNRTRQGGKAEVSPGGNQPKAPGVRVNIGGRRRQTKGKRKAKHSHGLQDFDPDMMDIEDEMARMFMADPFAFNADE
jgi:curved DNA-binding protein CbpA